MTLRGLGAGRGGREITAEDAGTALSRPRLAMLDTTQQIVSR